MNYEQAIQLLLAFFTSSKTGLELPVNTNPDGTEREIIYNLVTKRLETKQAEQNNNYFITIGNDIFTLVKGYTGSVKNTQPTLETNDWIVNGVIRNNGFNIFIVSAKYLGGTITDFGTYDNSQGIFQGGNYNIEQWLI